MAEPVSKYSNKKTQVGDIVFDSKREARRYTQLLLLQRAGEITGLTLQVPFVLAPSVKFAGSPRAKPALKYLADFVYSDVRSGCIVVEDVKGVQTEAFRIKLHLMKSVHGIDVKVSK